MTIARNDQNNVPATLGATRQYYIGVGSDGNGVTHDSPTYVGTPNSSSATLVLHGVNFSGSANSVTNGGSLSFDRITSVIDYTPLASLPAGTTVTYDVHAKEIINWVGVFASETALPMSGNVGDIAFAQGNYWRFDGFNWQTEGGNIMGNGVIDHFSSIKFQLSAATNTGGGGGNTGGGNTGGGGGTSTGAFSPRHLTVNWVIGTQTGNPSQFVIGGQNTANDVYSGGAAPVTLSTVNDPASSGSFYAYSAAGGTEAVANSHGTLERLSTNTNIARYNPTGNETAGDEYIYNIVAVDGNGDIVFSSLRIRIVATSQKAIDPTALATISSTAMRISSPFDLDLTPALINPNGNGTLTTTAYVNCQASDFTWNGNRLISSITSGDFDVQIGII